MLQFSFYDNFLIVAVGFRRMNVEQESFVALNDERLIVLHNSILYTERVYRAT